MLQFGGYQQGQFLNFNLFNSGGKYKNYKIINDLSSSGARSLNLYPIIQLRNEIYENLQI